MRVQANRAELHKKGLEFVVEQYDLGVPMFWQDIAPRTRSTNQQQIQFLQEGDFMMAPNVAEAGAIAADDIFHGHLKTITPVKRGLGFDISTEAEETDLFNRLGNIVPKIKHAFNKTKEQAAANRINNATSTASAYVNPDGKALAATDHPTDSSTDSNLITTAFSASALETMIQNMKLQKSHRGDPDPQMGPYVLFIHPSQEFLAERILFSQGQQGTANNDTNRLGKRVVKIVASPYFTSSTFWALRNADPRQQPFELLMRRGIKVKKDENINTDSWEYRLTEMYVFFENGWRGYYHSTGAG